MTREELDSEQFNAETASGGSETLEVQSGRASDIVVYVDDGSTGGSPASYSLTVDSYHDEFSDYHRQNSTTAGTDPYHSFDANGQTMQVTLTDESASAATRRILVKSYRDLD